MSVSGQAALVSVMSMVAMLASVHVQVVDQAEIDDVDAEFGVDDVLERLLDVLDQLGVVLGRRSHRSGGVAARPIQVGGAPARPVRCVRSSVLLVMLSSPSMLELSFAALTESDCARRSGP